MSAEQGGMRVLIVSAGMGEGHNATGRALERAVGRIWPDATVTWLDALDVMGPGIRRGFSWIYVVNVQRTPWLYEFFYRSLWQRPWFATASKRFVAAWAGRRLARPVADVAPDLVLSTYPLGTAGLEWLRRRRRLGVPVGAWVSDFAPHPFWVYADIDLNLVMHDVAVPLARRCVPAADVVVAAPPVDEAFAPADASTARKELGLPEEGMLALVTCGSLGFGDVEETARLLLAAHPDVVPVVVCGRNQRALSQVSELARAEPRVQPVGWTDQMASYVAAADVVVTNAGGMTALEALAVGRPLVLFRPIAAHGRGNADLMARAGLAVVCREPRELTRTIRDLMERPDRVEAMAQRALEHTSARSLEDGLRDLARRPVRLPPEPVRARDSLFLQLATSAIPQQLGAVLVFDPRDDGSPLTLDAAAWMLEVVPRLRQHWDGGGLWRRGRWRSGPHTDLRDVVQTRDITDVADATDITGVTGGRPPAGEQEALAAVMDEFFSRGVDRRADSLDACLVSGLEGGRRALLVKVHHAKSDGVALAASLVARTGGRWRAGSGAPRSAQPAGARTADLGPRLASVSRGLWGLARGGTAPRTGLEGPVCWPGRHHSTVLADAGLVRSLCRALEASTAELMLAVLAEALSRTLAPAPPERVRVVVPVSTRSRAGLLTPGNRTSAAPVDLPTGPMTAVQRVSATREVLRGSLTPDALGAADLVVRVIGALPPLLQRPLARRFYSGTWFNAIVTVLPSLRRPVVVGGAPLRLVYPVLPLAPGVRYSLGVMTCGVHTTVCITSSTDQAARADLLADRMSAVLAELVADVGGG
jgi:UDP-N-acetylglucosamine:LPS N-acetylglucosamine transferase